MRKLVPIIVVIALVWCNAHSEMSAIEAVYYPAGRHEGAGSARHLLYDLQCQRVGMELAR